MRFLKWCTGQHYLFCETIGNVLRNTKISKLKLYINVFKTHHPWRIRVFMERNSSLVSSISSSRKNFLKSWYSWHSSAPSLFLIILTPSWVWRRFISNLSRMWKFSFFKGKQLTVSSGHTQIFWRNILQITQRELLLICLLRLNIIFFSLWISFTVVGE